MDMKLPQKSILNTSLSRITRFWSLNLYLIAGANLACNALDIKESFNTIRVFGNLTDYMFPLNQPARIIPHLATTSNISSDSRAFCKTLKTDSKMITFVKPTCLWYDRTQLSKQKILFRNLKRLFKTEIVFRTNSVCTIFKRKITILSKYLELVKKYEYLYNPLREKILLLTLETRKLTLHKGRANTAYTPSSGKPNIRLFAIINSTPSYSLRNVRPVFVEV